MGQPGGARGRREGDPDRVGTVRDGRGDGSARRLARADRSLSSGYLGGAGFTLLNLEDVEDQAPRFGFGDLGEARFARQALNTSRIGVAFHRVRPDTRQAFGHRHQHAEEVYVVLGGGGRMKIDDEIHEITTLDAIRLAPESMRAFEAGPDGLEVLVFGPHHAGDGDLSTEFWPAGAPDGEQP